MLTILKFLIAMIAGIILVVCAFLFIPMPVALIAKIGGTSAAIVSFISIVQKIKGEDI